LRYLLLNLGNETRYHFPDAGQPTDVTLDPRADGLHEVQRYSVPTIGGFPLLQGGGPWGY
jgi:hypothetical protein